MPHQAGGICSQNPGAFRTETYFSFVAGATMDSSRCAKVDVIRYALENCGITDLSAAVMVGDREYDVIGASRGRD